MGGRARTGGEVQGQILPQGKEEHSSIIERLKNGAVALWEVIQNLLTEDAHSRKPEVPVLFCPRASGVATRGAGRLSQSGLRDSVAFL